MAAPAGTCRWRRVQKRSVRPGLTRVALGAVSWGCGMIWDRQCRGPIYRASVDFQAAFLQHFPYVILSASEGSPLQARLSYYIMAGRHFNIFRFQFCLTFFAYIVPYYRF